MAIRLSGETRALREGVENILAYYPYAARDFDGEISARRAGGEGAPSLKVHRSGAKIQVDYRRRCDFFRALGCILAGEENACERAAYEKSGVMLDVSRDAAYTLAQLKEFLVWIALCGFNACYLYMEDTYRLERYPYFGYLRGAYSLQELKELDDFADSLDIELIPCIQTLSHLGTTLKWDYALPMRDTAATLMVGCDETYAFIREMLSSLKGVFRTRRVHIGMDEAMDLGTGAYLRRQGFRPQFELMTEHLGRVTQIARELGLVPIIWDDMFYRSKDPNLDYYNPDVTLDENDIARVPQEVQLAYWDYYHNTQAEYECMLEKRKGFRQHLIFAGGIWKWNGWAPNYGKTFTTTHAALQACRNYRVDEILATLWADDGGEAALQTVWPGLVLFGQYAYGANTDDGAISRRCRAFTGLPLEGYRALEELDLLPGCERPNTKIRNPSKYLLYQDLLLGAFDACAGEAGIAAHYERCAQRLEQLAGGGPYPPAFDRMFALYTLLARVLAEKSNYGTAVRAAYRNKDREELRALCGALDSLAQKAAALHRAFVHMWCYGTKGAGLEVHDIRLGGLCGRVRTAQTRLTMFLNGELDRLDELEQEILPFRQQSGEDDGCPVCNKYHLIATQNLL